MVQGLCPPVKERGTININSQPWTQLGRIIFTVSMANQAKLYNLALKVWYYFRDNVIVLFYIAGCLDNSHFNNIHHQHWHFISVATSSSDLYTTVFAPEF